MREKALAWKWPNSEFSLFADDSLNDWRGPDPRPDGATIDQAEADYALVAAEVEAETRASNDLDTPLNKALRDVFLDLETRLRALGSTSELPDIAAATNLAKYTTAIKTILKTYP